MSDRTGKPIKLLLTPNPVSLFLPMPSLSLGVLTAHLRGNGYHVEQDDIHVKIWRDVQENPKIYNGEYRKFEDLDSKRRFNNQVQRFGENGYSRYEEVKALWENDNQHLSREERDLIAVYRAQGCSLGLLSQS
jgi:hypothetical protein